MPTRSRKRSPPATRRRALELLEASIDGCTQAIMLAYGFKTELLVELVNAGLATASIERMVSYMETIPGFATLGNMPWYPGKNYLGVIAQGQAAIRSRGG